MSESEGTGDRFSTPAKTSRAYNRILQDCSPASAAFFGDEETDISHETTAILFHLLDLPMDGSKKEKKDRAKILKGLEEKLGCTKFSRFKQSLKPDTITALLTTDVSAQLIDSLVYIAEYSKMFTVDDSSEMDTIIKEVNDGCGSIQSCGTPRSTPIDSCYYFVDGEAD